jgi:hypothetical protein
MAPKEGLRGRGEVLEILAIVPLGLLASLLPIHRLLPTPVLSIFLLTKAPRGFSGHSHLFFFPDATPA